MDHSIPVALEEIAEQEYDNDEARRTLHALDTGDFNHLAARYEKYEDEKTFIK